MTSPGPSLFPSPTLFPGTVIPPKYMTLGPLAFLDGIGVRFSGMRIEGWDAATGSSLSLTQKPRAPGAWRSTTPQRTARQIVLSGVISADSPDLMMDTIDAVNAAAAVDETPLWVYAHGSARGSWVSVLGDPVITSYPSPLVKGFALQLSAADPRKYGDQLTAVTGLPLSAGGLLVPFTVPVTIASTVLAGTCTLTNPGNTTGPVVVRISGPVSGPIVTHAGTGAALVFKSSLVLGAGEWIDVDMENQTVLAQGQASRSGYVDHLATTWSGFEPGVNVWAFTAAGYDPAAGLSVTVNPAWL